MTDYTHACGTSGTMMIRDTGTTIEFWINSGNSTTWTDHLPWGGTVNGVGVGGSYYYHQNSGWNKLGAWGVSTSQTVTFSLGNTGTSGFGSGTSFSVGINRSTVPPPPNPVQLSSITSTSMFAQFTVNGDGGSAIIQWQLGFGTDPNAPQTIVEANSGTFLVGLMTPGTVYYFWARGVNGNGTGGWSARTSATTLDVPEAPTIPVLSQITQTSIATGFRPNGDGGAPFTEFEIGYGTNPAVAGGSGSIPTPGDATVFGLQPGTTYYFWARARNSVGWGPWSESSSAMTIAGVRIKVGTVYKLAIPYVRNGGVWKLAQPWAKTAGEWKETG